MSTARTFGEMKWDEDVDTSALQEEFAYRVWCGLNDPRISIFTYIISAGRSLEKQHWFYDRWIAYRNDPLGWIEAHPGEGPPALAAVPGTSNHGRGLAVDLHLSSPNDTSANRALVADVLAEYGLWQPVRDAYGRIIEWWHFELDPGREPLPDNLWPPDAPVPTPEPPDPEDDDMPPLARIFSNRPDEAQFIRFSNGEVRHLGAGEIALYDDGGPYEKVPRVTEMNRQAYHQLVRESGTKWRPEDWTE